MHASTCQRTAAVLTPQVRPRTPRRTWGSPRRTSETTHPLLLLPAALLATACAPPKPITKPTVKPPVTTVKSPPTTVKAPTTVTWVSSAPDQCYTGIHTGLHNNGTYSLRFGLIFDLKAIANGRDAKLNSKTLTVTVTDSNGRVIKGVADGLDQANAVFFFLADGLVAELKPLKITVTGVPTTDNVTAGYNWCETT